MGPPIIFWDTSTLNEWLFFQAKVSWWAPWALVQKCEQLVREPKLTTRVCHLRQRRWMRKLVNIGHLDDTAKASWCPLTKSSSAWVYYKADFMWWSMHIHYSLDGNIPQGEKCLAFLAFGISWHKHLGLFFPLGKNLDYQVRRALLRMFWGEWHILISLSYSPWMFEGIKMVRTFVTRTWRNASDKVRDILRNLGT